jgi:16S rRNA processing protein RimM
VTELVAGRIAKSHGLTGEVAVEIRTDEPQLRFAVGATLTAKVAKSAPRTLTVRSVREHTGRLLVTFEGVGDRDAADQLRGALLLVDSDELAPSEDPDEFYDHELIGLAVIDQAEDRALGVVVDVAHGPGEDWLIMRAEGERAVLIPFVSAIVTEISRTEKKLWALLPEGLLDL